ncbi:MAG: hypothetical protein Q7T74_07050 [Candidatus Saccharibacteria bacterium]|nr:hypothetical protein [Candidatus Saccharibacteria bacterium]
MKLPHQSEAYLGSMLPYGNHLTHNIVRLPGSRGYLATIKVHGASFEMASNTQLNTLATRLKSLYKNIGKPEVAIWTNIIRHKYNGYPGGRFADGFASELNEAWRKKVESQELRVNDIYVSVLYRPEPIAITSFIKNLLEKIDRKQMDEIMAEEISVMEDYLFTVMQGLSDFYPDLLTTYMYNGNMFSEVSEFLHYLFSGYYKRIPIVRQSVSSLIAGSRPLFAKGGGIVLKMPHGNQTVAMLGTSSCPRHPNPRCLDELLGLPVDLVITHSMEFMGKQTALSMMQKHRDRMENSADKGVTEIEEIKHAEDAVTSGECIFGDYHFTVQVKGENFKKMIPMVGDALANNAFPYQRHDKAAAAAYLAQMPGNFRFRTNMFPMSSVNFAHINSLHNYAMGRKSGSQWGHAICMLPTLAGTPYFVNFHKHDEGGVANEQKIVDPDHREAANAIIFGRTGTGKTTFAAFLQNLMLKYWDCGNEAYLSMCFDLDQSQANHIRANGGRYFTIRNGFNTGFQPLQLPPTPANRDLVYSLILIMIGVHKKPISSTDEEKLQQAINGVMNEDIAIENRRISALLEFLDSSIKEGLYQRLLPWCHGGPKGWIFDNPREEIDIEGIPMVGFDLTEVFTKPDIQEVVFFYLLQRADILMDGRRFPIFIEELGQLSHLASIADYFEKKLVRIRKFNAFIVGLMQYPGQARGTPFEKSIASQTATQIYFSDASADFKDYVEMMKLTRSEYEFVRTTPKENRQILIKQGNDSTIVSFELSGLEDQISILSSNPTTADFITKLIGEVGDKPDVWMPVFKKRREKLIAEKERKDHENV